MYGIVKNRGIIFKKMLRTVAVMNIKIDDSHLFDAPLNLKIPGSNRHIVKITEPHGPIGLGMMSRGPDRTEGIVQGSFHHHPRRFQNTAYCQQCFNVTTADRTLCEICAHPQRDPNIICVVEEPLDVLALERTGGYEGKYHVLHGALSPIAGIGPEDVKIKELIDRLKAGGVDEVIIATNPSMEGDATAMYIHQQLETYDVRVTRLARGLPVGGDLEYADQNTLLRALSGRQEMD